ncbi:membrane-bound serine protease (ClpP class) [Opitutaceae bacterium TAV1]|nr:serine protease [Opitutaceae bacterium TAV5]EIP98158.1 membrane-bound serine protease (ClpP class) [Opitutaceae bacterium TAV1]
MTTLILLFIVGIILLAAEVIVPGAVLGTLGALAMLAGCVIAFWQHGPMGGGVAVAVALFLVGLMLAIEFLILPRTRWGRRFFLHKSIDSRSQPPVADAAAITRRTGETLTTLAPTGYVLVEGRRYEATSRSGLIEKGTPVAVIGTETFQLVVEKITGDNPPPAASSTRPPVTPGLPADNDLNKPVDLLTAPVYLPPVPPAPPSSKH